jgi:hypothetical protein
MYIQQGIKLVQGLLLLMPWFSGSCIRPLRNDMSTKNKKKRKKRKGLGKF